ncbi:S9 family peptidase [Frigoriglobus tundricola]|nr:alpha/beta fold hydrolase [Frigoriglobus tundricola]
MKTTPVALGVLLICAAVAPAAEPTPSQSVDTSFLKKYAETRRFMLGRPQSPKVAPDGKTVLFLRAEADKPTLKLFEFDVATGKSKEVLSPAALLKGDTENLTPEEKARRERMRLSAGGFADFHFDNTGQRVLLPLSGKLFVFDRTNGKVTELKTGEGGAVVDAKWSPDGHKVAYVRGFDVYVYDLATEKETPVTTGGTAIKTHGLAEFVAQEEMGRFTGYWWAPDGKHIAYEEADHTGVEVWYVADPFKPDQKPAEQFYPRPGKKNVSVRLGIVPVEGGETVWVEWDRKEYEYLARVEWQKYGPLTLMLQSRKQNTVDLFEADVRTGAAQRLLSLAARESDREWVNLDRIALYWSKDGTALLLRDQVTTIKNRGDNLARKIDIRSSFIKIDRIAHFDPDTGAGLFQASSHPHRMHAFLMKHGHRAQPLRLDEVVQLTRDNGVHTIAGTDKLPVVVSTTARSMPVTRVYNTDGKLVGALASVALEPDVTPNVEFIPDPSEPEFNDHGHRQSNPPKEDECFAAIVRPKNFDPKKKYPVIVDVYGGPRHLHVQQAMRNWLVPQWLADQGFIVVAIDNRGTPGRGSNWEAAVYQKFGTVPLEDQVKGLHRLCAKYPELDKDRVGIVGWSFGGYMAANGVLRAPDVFKAAVAGAPVTDWEDYDTHYTERYMGLLPESKKAYDDASLIPLAKDLKRPLLLVHGTADDNVYYRHTLKLANALFRAGRDFEALPLPGVTHMYTSDPVVMERLWAKTAGFFKTHLGEPK